MLSSFFWVGLGSSVFFLISYSCYSLITLLSSSFSFLSFPFSFLSFSSFLLRPSGSVLLPASSPFFPLFVPAAVGGFREGKVGIPSFFNLYCSGARFSFMIAAPVLFLLGRRVSPKVV